MRTYKVCARPGFADSIVVADFYTVQKDGRIDFFAFGDDGTEDGVATMPSDVWQSVGVIYPESQPISAHKQPDSLGVKENEDAP